MTTKFSDSEKAILLGKVGLEGPRTVGIKRLEHELITKVDVNRFNEELGIDVATIEYIEEYEEDGRGSCTVSFYSHEDASSFQNEFISNYGDLTYKLTWHETWPVKHDACRGMEIKLVGDGMEESDIRSYLEDEKYGGVKDSIEEVVFKDEETVAVVFKDASNLLNVLPKNSVIKLQNTTLHLKVMKPLMPPVYVPDDKVDRRKLWFRNIHTRSIGDETTLRSFIENISHSEIDYFLFYVGVDDVCVSMKTAPNYSRIMMETCTRPFIGHMIKVQMMPQTLQLQVATSSPMSKDDVKSYFSDKKKSGGGPVSWIEFKYESTKPEALAKHFILKFEEYEAINNVSGQPHEIDGIKCFATSFYGELYEDDLDRWRFVQNLPTNFDQDKSLLSQPYYEFSHYKASETIGIRNRKMRDIYSFLGKSKSNMNTIEYIEEYEDDHSTVKFKSCRDAAAFANKFISYYGTSSYELTWHETWPVRQDACRGLEIELVGVGLEESDIRSCFEDEKYAGVKDSIEEVVFKDKETVVVVYKDASDLQNVLSKNSVIELQNTTLHLNVMKPLMPPVYVLNHEVDRRKLWFRNIHARSYGDETMLRSFIENISQSEIDYFIFYDDVEDVFVSMKTTPDYTRIMMETCTRPFNGHMIKVQMMHQTLQIQVATSSPMNENDVKSYFSDNKKSGGGPVSCITFDFEEEVEIHSHFILWYNKSEDVDNVSRRLHEIDGIKCCVTPHYADVLIDYDTAFGHYDKWIKDLPLDFDPTKPTYTIK